MFQNFGLPTEPGGVWSGCCTPRRSNGQSPSDTLKMNVCMLNSALVEMDTPLEDPFGN